ncbi:MAG: lipase family protein [Clostridia bacterium]|nr:lipase family protein [Clostridia bacterium]
MSDITYDARLHGLFLRCMNAVYTHSGDSADYAIERWGTRLYLFFQWSDGLRDWQNNLDFPSRAYESHGKSWRVHRGFLRVWKSVRGEIEAAVSKSVSNFETTGIFCVGYSHGAAIAGLATEDMEFLFGAHVPVCGFGFGCPRFIWGSLPREVKDRFSRFNVIRNIPDIVTHLPPYLLGYRHGGPLVKIGKKGKYSPIAAHYPEAYLEETKPPTG